MTILLVCSKAFYSKLDFYKSELEKLGHNIIMPNNSDAPNTESLYRGTPEHAVWKVKMYKQSEEKIKSSDAVLVLNFDKEDKKNYIGGATFLEIYDAFKLGKKIFFINDLPEGMLKDELIGFSPIILYGELNKLLKM